MHLVNDLCRVLSYPENSDALREDEVLVMEMSLEDIPFNVSHFLITAPEKILIEAIFGDVPLERTAEILYRILHLNRELSESGGASVGYDVERSKIIYSQALYLGKTSGELLLGKMTEISWRAKYWQKTFFLKENDSGLHNSVLKDQFTSLA